MPKRKPEHAGEAHGYCLSATAGRGAKRTREGAIEAMGSLSQPYLEIRCLGEFSIRDVQHHQLRSSKRPKQLIALLQLLITAGAAGLARHSMAAMLWPDQRSPIAAGTLDSTLFRLRSMLGYKQAIVVSAGMIALEPRYVAVDAWLFLQEADILLARLAVPFDDRDSGEIAVRYERLVGRYGGPLLAGVAGRPLIIAARGKLDEKLQSVAIQVGRHWEMAGRWNRALQLFENIIALGCATDAIHTETMRCHFALGDYAKVVDTYKVIFLAQAGKLAAKPGSEAESLYQRALVEEIKIKPATPG